MKRFLYLSLSILLFLSACNTLLAPQPATSTPAPTNTLEPTFTPSPTETPTLVPTSTPNKTATAVAQATETSNTVLTELDELLGDTDIPYKQGHLVWKQVKQMSVVLYCPRWDYVNMDSVVIA